MRIILMRHGHCKGLDEGIINGWRDFPLTAKGRREPFQAAKNIEKLLGKVKIDKAYSSYLSRTYDTAKLFSEALGYKGKVKQDIRLNERHYGMFQGMTKEDAKAFKEYNTLSDSDKRLDNRLVPENTVRRDATLNEYSMKLKKPIKKIEEIIPYSESIIDVDKRINEFLDNEILVKSNENKTILIVTHANPAKLIVKKLDNLTYRKTSKLRFATCAMKIYDMRYNIETGYEIVTEYNINKEWEG